MRFFTLLIKIIIAEIVYVLTLLAISTYITPNNIGVNKEILIKGDLDSNRIIIKPDIYCGNLLYGDTSQLMIKLRRVIENQEIGDILTECSCTEYSIKYPPRSGDTITIQIKMKAVEYGKQIRRVHIYPSSTHNCEAVSLTLIADVK